MSLITNNSYLSGLIHRGMRKKIAEYFDEIYILNLHGNSLTGEVCSDGSKDENVFDIRQGVAICLMVKSRVENSGLAKIFYADLFGLRGDKKKRGTKYHYLWNNDIKTTKWQKLQLASPQHFFVKKDFSDQDTYDLFVSLKDIFDKHAGGIKTRRDNLMVAKSREELIRRFRMLSNPDYPEATLLQSLGVKNTKYWNVSEAKKIVQDGGDPNNFIKPYDYRPFDRRFVYYNPKIIERGDARFPLMKNFLENNLGLITMRQVVLNAPISHFFVTDKLSDMRFMLSNRGAAEVFPLYIFSDNDRQQMLLSNEQEKLDLDGNQHSLRTSDGKKVNFKQPFLDYIDKNLIAPDPAKRVITPEQILFYLYAILFSNKYREAYKEFLKIDFPRVPITCDFDLFQKLAGLGKELADLHLLKSKLLNQPIVKFYGKDTNLVEFRRYDEKRRRAQINDSQYFEGIKPEIWNYYVGGYQVLDKWLKDRKGRSLSPDDIKHYCRVVTALSETIKLQKKIDAFYPKVEEKIIKAKN